MTKATNRNRVPADGLWQISADRLTVDQFTSRLSTRKPREFASIQKSLVLCRILVLGLRHFRLRGNDGEPQFQALTKHPP